MMVGLVITLSLNLTLQELWSHWGRNEGNENRTQETERAR